MAEFDYKQRPFSTKLTDEEYDRAVGRDTIDRCLVCGKEIPPGPDFCSLECEVIITGPPPSKDRWTGQPKLKLRGIVEAPCDCAKPCGYRHWKRADAS